MAIRDSMRASATRYLRPGEHRIPAGTENLRVHRRFFKDIENADHPAIQFT